MFIFIEIKIIIHTYLFRLVRFKEVKQSEILILGASNLFSRGMDIEHADIIFKLRYAIRYRYLSAMGMCSKRVLFVSINNFILDHTL